MHVTYHQTSTKNKNKKKLKKMKFIAADNFNNKMITENQTALFMTFDY